MLEVLLYDYCGRKGIVLQNPEVSQELSQDRTVTGRKKNVGGSI